MSKELWLIYSSDGGWVLIDREANTIERKGDDFTLDDPRGAVAAEFPDAELHEGMLVPIDQFKLFQSFVASEA
jgi:hypothetical protein